MLFRLLAIFRTFARHDALFPLGALGLPHFAVSLVQRFAAKGVAGRPGERLAAALFALGPGFIKAGQALSTRPDLIGEALAADLAQLQDRLPPFPTAQARATIAAELGRPVDQVFASFDDTPVAAASIAQVHFATTDAGAAVAVKVLRPGVEDAFAADVALLRRLARLAERLRPDLRRLRLGAVVDTLAETVRIEMDLRMEAAAAAELAENLGEAAGFRVPKVDWQRTGRRVLTLARVEGIRIDDRERLIAAGHNPDTILAQAVGALFAQVFRDGFFHGDLHPGNLFVTADGAIAAVDFGIMGRLDAQTRRYLALMLKGFLERDYAAVARVHVAAGYVPADRSEAAFAQAARAIAEPILGRPLAEISLARLLAQLFQVTQAFQMETQPQLLLLQKNMLLAEGIGRRLNPAVNMWTLADAEFAAWGALHLGPGARLGVAAAEAVTLVGRLPAIARGLERLADGGANARALAHLEGERRFWRQAALLAGAALILALLFG
ncbi:MAG: 2-polyprenylphenol 6-hydroxylase [Alphaproteobacteria bacterium]|nr:2-polyprenylphenol 6-hydroxylase [Alphaproteobacteria bacterium]